MRAVRFTPATGSLAVEEIPDPRPGPGEVLVRVAACGICLSDVHLIDGTLPISREVVTPGHEAAGTIDALGDGVVGWSVGDRVVMAGGRPCGRCRACTLGQPDACEAFEIMGFAFDGAWAELVVVPSGACTPVPDGIPLEQAAVLADAVATPYAGLVERAGLRPGQSVGLWGIGGLGVHAVQIARLVGAAPIVAVDPSPAARQRALDRGADHALDPAEGDVPGRIRALTGGRGLDLAVDLVGANAVLADGDASLARGGTVLMVGLSMEPVHLGVGAFFGLGGHTLMGHLGYRKAHLDQLVALVASGRLDVSGSVTGLLSLDEAPAGVERLATKEGDPIRLVVQPDR